MVEPGTGTGGAPVDLPRDQSGQVVRDWHEPLAQSTAHTVALAHELDEEAVRAPSLLPGWTRGHVLAHLARNADGFLNLVRWAQSGVETPMYPDRASRDAEIERGSARPAAELAADLEASSARLLAALDALTPAGLDAEVRAGSSGRLRGRDIPWRRRRELEIHLVDLDAGRTPAHWPEDFAPDTLDELAELFRTERDTPVRRLLGAQTGREWQVGAGGPDLYGPETGLLAWLIGRSDGDGLDVRPHGPVPRAPRWV